MRRIIATSVPYLGVLLGGAAALLLVKTRPQPPLRDTHARMLEVETLPAGLGDDATAIVGRGTIRPKHQINIVPQVSGQLIYVHRDLATGKRIPKGDLLFEIDPALYESQRRQAEAEVRRLEASLDRAGQEMANLDERIANGEQMLAIDEKEYQTSKQLFEVDNVGTKRDVDMAYQNYLRQKDALIELRNRRSVLPLMKMETQARLDASRARLDQVEHDLKNTKIHCPFDARVDVVTAYRSQVVTAHFSIATLTDMSAFELAVGIDPYDLRWLDDAITPQALEHRTKEDDSGPAVKVRWSLQGESFSWRGYVTRFEKVDEATRTARLVVEIRDVDMVAHVDKGNGDHRPALAIGMHCRAELPARPLVDALFVPRHAIYNNHYVYVVEPGDDARTGRLARRSVPILRSLGDNVLVDYAGRKGTETCELRPGEEVVVSPLVKPVVGMQVRIRDQGVASSFGGFRIPVQPIRGTMLRAIGSSSTTTMVLAETHPIPGGG